MAQHTTSAPVLLQSAAQYQTSHCLAANVYFVCQSKTRIYLPWVSKMECLPNQLKNSGSQVPKSAHVSNFS